jgi:hypothetical protein
MMVCKGCGTMHILLPEGATFDCPLCAANRERDEALARASEALALLATGTWRCDRCEAAEAEAQGSGEPAARAIYSNGATDRDGDWLEDETQGGGEQ